jgi:hypothetical protein
MFQVKLFTKSEDVDKNCAESLCKYMTEQYMNEHFRKSRGVHENQPGLYTSSDQKMRGNKTVNGYAPPVTPC